mmetsp:Transcript_28857/g.95984  ORF Transcript_28857/g.95984 Transcript_28857/m.95984 type:complete len:210 (+) Transcript_28857:4073-4702(+)
MPQKRLLQDATDVVPITLVNEGLQKRLAQCFLLGPTRNLSGLAVPLGDVATDIDAQDRRIGRVDEAREVLCNKGLFQHRVAHFRQILTDRDDASDLACRVTERRTTHCKHDYSARLGDELKVELVVLTHAKLNMLDHLRNYIFGLLDDEVIDQRPAEDLVLGVACHAGHLAIPLHDVAADVHTDDGCIGALDEMGHILRLACLLRSKQF